MDGNARDTGLNPRWLAFWRRVQASEAQLDAPQTGADAPTRQSARCSNTGRRD